MEEWRDIPEWEGMYQASTFGRVKSLARLTVQNRWTVEQLLTPQKHRGGYKRITLWRAGVNHQTTAHRLVALTFLGPPPDSCSQVCHNNGDKSDNRMENLRWDTPSGNNFDKRGHGVDWEVNKTCCPLKHPLREPNLVVRKWRDRGHRECRSCNAGRSFIRRHGLSMDLLPDVAETYRWKFSVEENAA